jgi:hypothetical protein
MDRVVIGDSGNAVMVHDHSGTKFYLRRRGCPAIDPKCPEAGVRKGAFVSQMSLADKLEYHYFLACGEKPKSELGPNTKGQGND